MDNYVVLDWDSAFFGFTVAKIVPDRLTALELEETLGRMRRNQVALVYWASDPADVDSQLSARSCGGFLADRKVTYVIDAADIPALPVFEACDLTVEAYTAASPSPELEDLAIQAGIFSRFNIDPRMPENLFVGLYKLWILKSVQKDIADAVLVARSGDRVVGMVTVGKKGERSDIGLIAVDAAMRGRNLGLSLVRAAQEWALDHGFTAAQVVTQGENLAACRLYEKCGYRIDTTQNIYHFWTQL